MNGKNILINQSVAILCDGNNIERSIHEISGSTNTMINFDMLIPKLLNGRGLNRLIYFREGKNISSKFAERLHELYYGSVVPCHKSADIPLSIKATQLASKVDTIIIMSGDSDYVELVTHLKAEGVRVEIAAVRKTTARILVDEADYFHPITKEDWFAYNSMRKMSHKPTVKKFVAKRPLPSAPPKVEVAVQEVKKVPLPTINHVKKNIPKKPLPSAPPKVEVAAKEVKKVPLPTVTPAKKKKAVKKKA
jgi:hypothetical protein